MSQIITRESITWPFVLSNIRSVSTYWHEWLPNLQRGIPHVCITTVASNPAQTSSKHRKCLSPINKSLRLGCFYQLKGRSKTKLQSQKQDADCHGIITSLQDMFACSGKIATFSVCPLLPETRFLKAHVCWVLDPKGHKQGPKSSPSFA